MSFSVIALQEICTENVSLITMALKTGVIIGTNTFSAIGFTIERKSGVPAQTSQPITVTIVNGSGATEPFFKEAPVVIALMEFS